jgi:hypothetical protein
MAEAAICRKFNSWENSPDVNYNNNGARCHPLCAVII